MKNKDKIQNDIKSITQEELNGLIQRIKATLLSERDKELVIGFIEAIVALRTLVTRRTIAIKSLLRKMFGLKTEEFRRKKTTKSGEAATNQTESDAHNSNEQPGEKPQNGTSSKKTHKGGTGRNGKDDYPGAKRITLKHDHLCEGDNCPVCLKGKLQIDEPGIAYRWTGNLPLTLTIYELERLICHSCKSTFTAKIPGEAIDTSKLDPSAPVEMARPRERECDATVAASIVTLRFEYGVPNYRLADIQEAQGVPLPASTQVTMMEPLRKPAEVVVNYLEKHAGANGELVINDDTHMRLLAIERGEVLPPEGQETKPENDKLLRPQSKAKEKKEEIKGKRATTSAFVVKFGEHTVCLHYTGFSKAGDNLAKILAHRDADAAPPVQMCDALGANIAPGFVTILGNCLDHARRQFYDLESYYPREVGELFSRLGKVYANDAKAKEMELDADEKLTWHQMHSAAEMGEIWLWARGIKNNEDTEPNGDLMPAVKYLLRHWDELTLFLRVAGAPLSSAEVEQLIKRCIRHRKNSMQYKTLRGARFGDMMMTLIQTCRYCHASAHAYLTAIGRFADEVIAAPVKWLPWNYQEALAGLSVSDVHQTLVK